MPYFDAAWIHRSLQPHRRSHFYKSHVLIKDVATFTFLFYWIQKELNLSYVLLFERKVMLKDYIFHSYYLLSYPTSTVSPRV